MGYFSNLRDKIIDRVLASTDTQRLYVEAAQRGEKTTKTKSGQIIHTNRFFTPKKHRDWVLAVGSATDSLEPDFTLLAELYDNLLLDNHVVSIIENRIYRVLQSKKRLLNQADEEDNDLLKLFEASWFEQFVKASMWSIFTGVKVLELFELDEHLELKKVTTIPMAHTLPYKGIFTKEEGERVGWNYKEGSLKRYYIQVGEDKDIGLLANLAPVILGKKLAIGSWLDHVQRYGVAARWVITDREDQTRLDELYDMMANMQSSHFAVLRGQERIEIVPSPNTDAHKVFDELIARFNSELSKAVLGQDGTSDHSQGTGTYGSLKVLADVANDRHESDKQFIKNLVNKVLIPKLVGISSAYAKLQGYEFDWDDTVEVSNTEFIQNVVQLSNAGFELNPEQITEKTGLEILGQKVSKNNEPQEEEENQPKGSKKKALK